METKKFIGLIMVVFVLFILNNILLAQDTYDEKSEMLDLKLELLDSKIELLESKLKVWENKPQELDMALKDIEAQVYSLNLDPGYMNYKFNQLDSLIKANNYNLYKTEKVKLKPFRYDTVSIKPYRYVISMNPLNLSTGTLELNFEKVINYKNTIDISASFTYATDYGISNIYLKNQQLDYYNMEIGSYMPYNAKNITDFGTSLEFRNYLLAKINPKQIAPKGLYAAPQLKYRRAFLFGIDRQYNEEEDEWFEEEVKRCLNIFTGGVIIGLRLSFIKVLCIDGYIGGIIRLAKYDDEDSFTKYKNIKNIDYSGVMPTAGIKIGILK